MSTDADEKGAADQALAMPALIRRSSLRAARSGSSLI